MSDEFTWDDPSDTVFPTTQGVAVYRNKDGDIVIRQEARYLDDEDSFIVIPESRVDDLILALQGVRDS